MLMLLDFVGQCRLGPLVPGALNNTTCGHTHHGCRQQPLTRNGSRGVGPSGTLQVRSGCSQAFDAIATRKPEAASNGWSSQVDRAKESVKPADARSEKKSSKA